MQSFVLCKDNPLERERAFSMIGEADRSRLRQKILIVICFRSEDVPDTKECSLKYGL